MQVMQLPPQVPAVEKQTVSVVAKVSGSISYSSPQLWPALQACPPLQSVAQTLASERGSSTQKPCGHWLSAVQVTQAGPPLVVVLPLVAPLVPVAPDPDPEVAEAPEVRPPLALEAALPDVDEAAAPVKTLVVVGPPEPEQPRSPRSERPPKIADRMTVLTYGATRR